MLKKIWKLFLLLNIMFIFARYYGIHCEFPVGCDIFLNLL